MLAGGVALIVWLRCTLKKIENIWIQPAAGDAGGSLGAALAWYIDQKNPREVNLNDDMKGSYLGTEFTQEKLKRIKFNYTF